MNKYLPLIASVLSAALKTVYEYLLALIARIPGAPDVRSVDYALSNFTKLEERLSTAVTVALNRGDRLSELVDKYDELAEVAYADADRAAKVQQRLRTLLR